MHGDQLWQDELNRTHLKPYFQKELALQEDLLNLIYSRLNCAESSAPADDSHSFSCVDLSRFMQEKTALGTWEVKLFYLTFLEAKAACAAASASADQRLQGADRC